MAEKPFVPIYLPYWMYRAVLKVKRAFITPPPPPHESSHWPDITTICKILSMHDTNRYVVVHDDVIIGVPDVAKSRLTDFIRGEMLKSGLQPPTKSVRRTPFSWTRSIIGRRT